LSILSPVQGITVCPAGRSFRLRQLTIVIEVESSDVLLPCLLSNLLRLALPILLPGSCLRSGLGIPLKLRDALTLHAALVNLPL